jgi:hypothetical protein
MKIVAKIAVVAIVALLISGFDTNYFASKEKPSYRKICHTVQSGETLWEIGEKYYDGSKPFTEFMHELSENNGFGIGKRQHLQVGETIIVKIEDAK